MALNIASTNEQKVPVISSPATLGGRPAQLDGALRVSVVSGNGTFSQDPATPLVFMAISGDADGVTEYHVEGDSDLSDGEALIFDDVIYTVTAAAAASLGLAAGPAEPK